MPLSNYAKDKFVAPYMSEFTEANLESSEGLSDQSDVWVSNFIQNSMLRASFNPPFHQYMFNFVKRAEATLREYERARIATQEFLATPGSASGYMRAIFHWEVWLSQAWHAYELLYRLVGQDKVFTKGDGSVEERLNRIYNQSKHVAGEIESGRLPTEEATMAVWLTNAGLRSQSHELAFSEVFLVLKDMARWGDRLQDPLKFAKEHGETPV